GQFADALKWLQLLLDPAEAYRPIGGQGTPANTVSNGWRIKPLFTPGNYQDLPQKNAQWLRNPFDVHALAEWDPGLYRYAVARQYVDTLVAWGDFKFRLDTRETIAEALLIYHLASRFLGPRPQSIEVVNDRRTELTFHQIETAIQTEGATGLPLPLIDVENMIVAADRRMPTIRFDPQTSSASPIDVSYFCFPHNDHFLYLWDVLEDRLHKIRHCLNIDGIFRQLPLWEPAIDVGALVAATAAGLDLSSITTTSVSPHIRFQAMLELAQRITSRLQRLGQSLQSALRQKDAEHLALLREEHQTTLLELGEAVRDLQIEATTLERDARESSKATIEIRKEHYEQLKDKSPNAYEELEEWAHDQSSFHYATAAFKSILYNAFAYLPQTSLGIIAPAVTPTGPGIAFKATTSFGGQNVANAFQAMELENRLMADEQGREAGRSGRRAAQERRLEDWNHQIAMADREIAQIDVDLETLERRIEVSKSELALHQRQIENARSIEAWVRGKYSNEDLYDWLEGEINQLQSATYDLALDVARKAEHCFRRERGVTVSSYVGSSHYSGSHKGALAGDKLMADLQRLEVAYVDDNARELELTKHVSLERLDPTALAELQSGGSCLFAIPEVLFDLDHAGHYMRRIRSVAISIPCGSGRYSAINGTLILTRSRVRTQDTASEASYPNDDNFSEERWSERIAFSTGLNDTGHFESGSDGRYRTFEHRGAVSEWSLQLSGAAEGRPQFDWTNIQDVVLTIQYTARYSVDLKSPALSNVTASLDALRGAGQPWQVALSLRRQAPDVWAALIADPTADATVEFGRDRLPYLLQMLDPRLASVSFVMVGALSATDIVDPHITSVGFGADTLGLAHPDETAPSTAPTGLAGKSSQTGDFVKWGPTPDDPPELVTIPAAGQTTNLTFGFDGSQSIVPVLVPVPPGSEIDTDVLVDIVILFDFDVHP
ncbi:MAG: hypothetical protein AAF211_17300, partial [Myxococcota bacterium]